MVPVAEPAAGVVEATPGGAVETADPMQGVVEATSVADTGTGVAAATSVSNTGPAQNVATSWADSSTKAAQLKAELAAMRDEQKRQAEAFAKEVWTTRPRCNK